MTEVAEGPPTTGVAPRAVLGGHPDDEPADRVHDPWAARSATAAAVVCPRDQLSMPAEEGIGRDQGVPVTAYPSPEARGLCGPAPALGVGEPETARTALLSEDAMLFLESVNDVTRLLVDPARDGHDEELQHVGKRRHTGRASQRLSAVTNVATRRASSVESARRTASIGFLDSTPSHILIAYEFADASRTIYIDSDLESPFDTWIGHSTGRWEGDTLVVDVTSFNDQTWFDRAGNVHSNALQVVESYTPIGPDHIDYEATITESQACGSRIPNSVAKSRPGTPLRGA